MEFLEWERLSPILFPSYRELIQGYIEGLALQLWLASEHLISIGSTFRQVVFHVKAMEQACLEAYKDSGRMPHHHYNS